MGIINKIVTAVRGAASETGEAIIKSNSSRIVEQEIRDAEAHLNDAKRDVTEVMAKETESAREVERLTAEIKRHEEYVVAALAKKDEKLALEISERIAEFTDELTVQSKAKAIFTEHVDRLKAVINKTDKAITSMNRQLSLIKATDSLQKATISITDGYATSTSGLAKAKESMEQIQKQQQHTEDVINAGMELHAEESGKNLEDKLKNIGIIETPNSAQEILAKIKAANKGGK